MNQLPSIHLDREDLATRIIGFLLLVVYVGCFSFPLIDKDAAHHANIALRMLQYNDYASLVDREMDYLDKPHLLFWSSALSFKIFGVTTFAHRLPALLYALLSVYSTYKLSLHLGNKSTARLAAIMLGTAQGFIISINDARMETPLTAGIIFGLWQLIVYVDRGRWWNHLLGALGVAIAFSTKGWIGPIIIFVTLFFYLLMNKRWDVLAKAKTWLFIPFFFLFISPVLYAYYLQFDLHPEKVIRGMDNISGIKFILWDQNFERFDGDSFKKGGRNSEYFFLYHTFLWAYFPWSILAYLALVVGIKRVFSKTAPKSNVSFAALAFGFLLFVISFSNFKMPHYIFWFLPLVTLFAAPYLRELMSGKPGHRFFYILHVTFAVLVLLATIALNFYFFQPASWWAWTAGIALILALIYVLIKPQKEKGLKLVYVSAGLSIVFNFFVNYSFFPNLFRYQGGEELVELMEEKGIEIDDSKIKLIDTHAHSFDFYSGYNHSVANADSLPRGDSSYYYLLGSGDAHRLIEKGYTIDTLVSHPDFNVSTIKLKFLRNETRESTLDTLMLARVY